MIHLVCFDLGRVLIRICEDWGHACEVAGVKLPAGLGKPDAATQAEIGRLIALYDSGKIDLAQFASAVAPLRGLRAQDVIDLQEAYLLGPYPGVVELIDDLRATGVKTACLSNTTENHWRQMLDPNNPNYLPLEKLDFRFASFLAGARKPGDEIYQHVERETGVEGSQILFFDDAKENIETAARRGWRAVLIEHDGDPVRQVRKHLRQADIV
jgi:HAD superfamily hydrolase (TIGR01509 family)